MALKVRTTITLDKILLDQAKELQINISKACTKGIIAEIESLNDYVVKIDSHSYQVQADSEQGALLKVAKSLRADLVIELGKE